MGMMLVYRYKSFSARKAECPDNFTPLYLSDNEEVSPFHNPLLDLLLHGVPDLVLVLIEVGAVEVPVPGVDGKLHHLLHLPWGSLERNRGHS